MLQHIKSKMINVRKEHFCHVCGNTIKKGMLAEVSTNRYEGEIYNIYTCNKCLNYCKVRNCIECFEGDGAQQNYISDCYK